MGDRGRRFHLWRGRCHGLDNGLLSGDIEDDGTFSLSIAQQNGSLGIVGVLPNSESGFQGTWELFSEEGEGSGPLGSIDVGDWLPPGRWGDMNCDASVNSIDAYYILTGRSRGCKDRQGLQLPNVMALGADANVDNVIDSRDALLILQQDAGLVERLPVL